MRIGIMIFLAVFPDSPNPRATAFLDAYAEAYPGQAPSAFAALGYDAVKLLAA